MLRDITIGQYYNIKSIIHSLDPRVKLMGTLVFLMSLFLSGNIFGYILATFALTIVIKKSKVPFKFMIRGLKSLIFLLLLSVIFNIFLTPGRVIWKFYFLQITIEGIKISFMMALRLVYLVIGSSILTLTTTPNELTSGIEKGLGFMKKFNVPIAEIAMMMSISLRFIPILIEETDRIMKAQIARGANFDEGNLFQKAKAMIPLLVPLFIQAFRRANDLAEAMESRFYNSSVERTKLHPLIYSNNDKKSYCFMFIFLLCMIATHFIKI
ncbi:MAG: energy-coupling factor transporter transmembrane component T [Eubacteriales bacterium]|nr:energy-coupling factor transporter transmembrane component T [Eubacteriales bacterium]